MKYRIEATNRFRKDYKLAMKRGFKIELLDDVIRKLAAGIPLPEKTKITRSRATLSDSEGAISRPIGCSFTVSRSRNLCSICCERARIPICFNEKLRMISGLFCRRGDFCARHEKGGGFCEGVRRRGVFSIFCNFLLRVFSLKIVKIFCIILTFNAACRI